MSPSLFEDIRAWIGDSRRVEALACDDIIYMAQAVLGDFWAECPEHRTTDNGAALVQLEMMATAAGFENMERFVGSAVCQANGDMTLEIKAVENV